MYNASINMLMGTFYYQNLLDELERLYTVKLYGKIYLLKFLDDVYTS